MDREFFFARLKDHKKVQLSFRPEIPENEKIYDVLGAHTYETVTGLLLVLELLDKDDNKKITFCYPDIQKIEMNNLSNEYQEKYYLMCLSRPQHFRSKELMARREMGSTVDEKELSDNLKDSEVTYRIIFRLN
ncbi:hypothetical protein [Tumebacillus avium]|uniref:hypothetical protein n=1 Tax=Tumebacillus avium TaxID=1903704 RepID=UPI0018E00491|nr:hypothetical protein [Tumebacillus avium]